MELIEANFDRSEQLSRSIPQLLSGAPQTDAILSNLETGSNESSYSAGTVGTSTTTEVQSPAQNSNSICQSTTTHTEDIIPTYPNNCPKIGKALMINNIKFLESKERHGAEKDSRDLEKLLRTIGFEVESKRNLSRENMLKKVGTFSKSNFSNCDISLVVIMSHGNNIARAGSKLVRVRGGYTEINGIDDMGLLIDEVLEKFIGHNCHQTLRGKPKIFIFQCCRGEIGEQEYSDDASGPTRTVIHQHSDMLVAYSTLPGYASNRDPITGSWYIQSICEIFEQHYKEQHVEDMLILVNTYLSGILAHPNDKQTSMYENRGFKRCYLCRRRN